MSKSIDMDTLSEDAKSVLEELMSADGPIVISRSGHPIAGLVSCSPVEYADLDKEQVEPPQGADASEPAPASNGWRSTVGAFDNDPIMADIAEAGRRIRESDRQRL